MAHYLYLKSEPLRIADLQAARSRARLIAFTLVFSGVLLVAIYLVPLLHWQFYTQAVIKSQKLLSPQPSWQAKQLQNVTIKTDSDGFSYFVQIGSNQASTTNTGQFFLTIPKLGIKDALVLINNQQFSQNLAHFPGTALPGEEGNVFITGHSALSQFFSPKDYKTIFSTLDKLEENDLLIVQYQGRDYQYQVIGREIVDPTEISVLLPIDDFGGYLTLMTCVPPGLNNQRLIVTAKFAKTPTDFLN